MYAFFFIFLVVLVAFLLIDLLRSRKIKEKYVWIWLALDLLALLLLFLPINWVETTANFFGFLYASNMIFAIVIAVLIFAVIHLSASISKLEEDKRVLSEEIAMLNNIVQNHIFDKDNK